MPLDQRHRFRPLASCRLLVALALLVILVAGLGGRVATGAQDATPAGTAVAGLGPNQLIAIDALPAVMPRAEGPIAVAASIGLVTDMVLQVAGERAVVTTVLPANADPHDFEPTPQDVVAVEDAAVIFLYGLNLDQWATSLVESSGTEVAPVAIASGFETLASDEEGFELGDPHAWFDPRNVKVMVDNIAAALTAHDPAGAADYQARATAYQAQLDQLDAAIEARLGTVPPENRKLVTNHDAFGYYAARYGLEVVGTVIPSLDTRAEPSAREIADLVDVIERERVPAIFAENTTSPQLAEQLADQTGVRVIDTLYTDSLGEPGSGADTYLGLMQFDTVAIADALSAGA